VANNILEWLKTDVVLGDGGYLLELERRGHVQSGSEFEAVGTGQGSGQYTPEIVIENPAALSLLHSEFIHAGSRVLQALTFYATRQKLSKSGYGAKVDNINHKAVQLAREAAAGKALVAGTISRTQLFEREGGAAADYVRELFEEQIRLLAEAGVDFFILETFFAMAEMSIALDCVAGCQLPVMATMSFRPEIDQSADGVPVMDCARMMADAGADIVGANCEQEPGRILTILRSMRAAVDIPIAGQPAAFRTTDDTPCFTKMAEFPDDLETIQLSRRGFYEFAQAAKSEGINYIGGCCGCNAAYIRAMAKGLQIARS
jgi:betaine-homocysteine S-methyltransferase